MHCLDYALPSQLGEFNAWTTEYRVALASRPQGTRHGRERQLCLLADRRKADFDLLQRQPSRCTHRQEIAPATFFCTQLAPLTSHENLFRRKGEFH